MAEQNYSNLSLKPNIMPFFWCHDTKSDIINYIETLYLNHNVKLYSWFSGI